MSRSPHFGGFEITLRHTKIGRTPLDAWSARRQDLYLTTHNTQKIEVSVFLAAFEPANPASERLQTHSLNRAATGIGPWLIRSTKMYGRNLYLSWKPKLIWKEPVKFRQCNKEVIHGTGWIISLSTDSRSARRPPSLLPIGAAALSHGVRFQWRGAEGSSPAVVEG
jgi:hypothetical protein